MSEIYEKIIKRYKSKYEAIYDRFSIWDIAEGKYTSIYDYSVEDLKNKAKQYLVFVPKFKQESYISMLGGEECLSGGEIVPYVDTRLKEALEYGSYIWFDPDEKLLTRLAPEIQMIKNIIHCDAYGLGGVEKEEGWVTNNKVYILITIIKYARKEQFECAKELGHLGRDLWLFLSLMRFHIEYEHYFLSYQNLRDLNNEYNKEIGKINSLNLPPRVNLFDKKTRINGDSPYIDLEKDSIIQLLIKYFGETENDYMGLARLVKWFNTEIANHELEDPYGVTHREEINLVEFSDALNDEFEKIKKEIGFTKKY